MFIVAYITRTSLRDVFVVFSTPESAQRAFERLQDDPSVGSLYIGKVTNSYKAK